MNTRRTHIFFAGLVCLAYPILASGQTSAPDPTQLAADQAACQKHAVAYSGYSPAAPPPSTSSAPPVQGGAGLRGAARGAFKGAIAGGIVEEVGDDPRRDEAAETGAALGAVRGASKGIRASQSQAAAAPPPPPAGDPNAYAKSYDECMSGKGYAKGYVKQ